MALVTTIKKMKEEATCSLCQQLMTKPVSIECEHSFCRKCIEDLIKKQQQWDSDLEEFNCPLCWETFERKDLRPMKQLENLIETVKKMERDKLCNEHGEQLHLFCEDTGQLICWCCERSLKHKGHNHVLGNEAYPEYKGKIQDAVAKLRQQEDECNNLKVTISRKILKWESLLNLLRGEELDFLEELEMEKWQTLKKLQDSEASVERQSSELKSHILELQKKHQESTLNLLKGVKDTLNRSSAMKLQVPEAVSLEPRTVCNVSELYFNVRDMLKTYQVSVTLDPETAHSNLILSEDGRKVTHGGTQKKCHNSKRFLALPCVLGSEGFTSGRHYFEVDVGQGTEWALGVCLEDVPRDRDMQLKPESGFWVIMRKRADGRTALTDHMKSVFLPEKPQIMGVFLDYEAGCVSFYNMPTGFLLHTFHIPSASFSKTLRPFFWVDHNSSLFLPPPDEKRHE
ncbi:E3 ubiquitin-protein ligase TRIM38-like isoform X2 [Talpa occidentalis]|uniref:E3 ubiquitin-protein ligase TRIM38-like isoform X2 n=1 Tax=Talpa occidentalis TaxID=50954 RepID=UPI0023FA013A|nr:E3 ubiquitin-protein ligase TRIM38-like isoform X2 [Talpa occidentalis]